ncbi:MAG: response regulator [Candidatus Melainabacteria bacterium]|nr:response regulator [Candidatus Melainabacteria bacterium]
MSRSIKVLLVEDSVADATMIQEILADEKIEIELSVVRDGFEAMDFLHFQNGYENVSRPDLVFLDLNMPKKDGREVLAEMKSSLTLRAIPVVILTTSNAEEDILQAYDLHASCYLIKPIDLSGFIQLVKYIELFWFSSVQYPNAMLR